MVCTISSPPSLGQSSGAPHFWQPSVPLLSVVPLALALGLGLLLVVVVKVVLLLALLPMVPLL